MKILAIESSCDETAAAIVEDGTKVLSSVVSSQIDIHKNYGGVVPEIASRHHCENILPVVSEAMGNFTKDDIDAIAVTYTPGLIGALLVGVNFAKGLALAWNKPLIPVNHLQGHIASLYISKHITNEENHHSIPKPSLAPPFLCLVVSGGHTNIVEVLDYTKFKVLGRTLDDAAGECFDKCARTLGLPYPGGVELDRMVKPYKIQMENDDTIECSCVELPTPKVDGCNFSFSGLKTSVINLVHNAEQKGEEIDVKHIACSLQTKISHILAKKTLDTAYELGYSKVAVTGGVSANSGVRETFKSWCKNSVFHLYLPELKYCGDNAAMIAAQAFFNYKAGIIADMTLDATAARWDV